MYCKAANFDWAYVIMAKNLSLLWHPTDVRSVTHNKLPEGYQALHKQNSPILFLWVELVELQLTAIDNIVFSFNVDHTAVKTYMSGV